MAADEMGGPRILRGESRVMGLVSVKARGRAQAVMPRERMCSNSGWTWAR